MRNKANRGTKNTEPCRKIYPATRLPKPACVFRNPWRSYRLHRIEKIFQLKNNPCRPRALVSREEAQKAQNDLTAKDANHAKGRISSDWTGGNKGNRDALEGIALPRCRLSQRVRQCPNMGKQSRNAGLPSNFVTGAAFARIQSGRRQPDRQRPARKTRSRMAQERWW
jgi:hypothetical protein